MVRTLVADRTALSEARAEIERLRLIVQKLQRSQFGRRAEQLDDHQLLFGFEDLRCIRNIHVPTASPVPASSA
jgi:transposase